MESAMEFLSFIFFRNRVCFVGQFHHKIHEPCSSNRASVCVFDVILGLSDCRNIPFLWYHEYLVLWAHYEAICWGELILNVRFLQRHVITRLWFFCLEFLIIFFWVFVFLNFWKNSKYLNFEFLKIWVSFVDVVWICFSIAYSKIYKSTNERQKHITEKPFANFSKVCIFISIFQSNCVVFCDRKIDTTLYLKDKPMD